MVDAARDMDVNTIECLYLMLVNFLHESRRSTLSDQIYLWAADWPIANYFNNDSWLYVDHHILCFCEHYSHLTLHSVVFVAKLFNKSLFGCYFIRDRTCWIFDRVYVIKFSTADTFRSIFSLHLTFSSLFPNTLPYDFLQFTRLQRTVFEWHLLSLIWKRAPDLFTRFKHDHRAAALHKLPTDHNTDEFSFDWQKPGRVKSCGRFEGFLERDLRGPDVCE